MSDTKDKKLDTVEETVETTETVETHEADATPTTEPKEEEPKAEEPKAEEPKAEEPKAEEPKVEKSKVEKPKVEKSKVEKSKVEEPKAEEPKVEKSKTEKPKAEKVKKVKKAKPVKEKSGETKEPTMGRLVLVLFAITATTALLLALLNMLTAPVIAQNEMAKKTSAMAAVLPYDGQYTLVEYKGTDATVGEVYKAGNAGYVVEVSPTGSYSGTFSLMVGVDANGTCTGVEVIASAETSGLGSNASKPVFKDQFVGESGSVAVTKDGGAVDALTGATMTSRSMANGVTTALAVAKSMG